MYASRQRESPLAAWLATSRWFLRQFSAPVKVQYQRRAAAELDFLARHDQDGFVRWDALQSMWMSLFDVRQSVPTYAAIPTPCAALRSRRHVAGILLRSSWPQLCLVLTKLYLFEQLRGFDAHALLDSRDAAVALVATNLPSYGEVSTRPMLREVLTSGYR